MAQRVDLDDVDYLASFDREIQKFMFMFLPNLFHDMAEAMEEGFTPRQIQAVNSYFHEARTLTAITYPYRYLLIFGNPTYRRVRKLHRKFERWCEAYDESDTPLSKKRKSLEDMEDALCELSKNYRVVRSLRLTAEKRRLLLSVIGSMNDAVKGLTRIGLKSVNRFIERSMDENIDVSEASEDIDVSEASEDEE